jgi:hypothetical protein
MALDETTYPVLWSGTIEHYKGRIFRVRQLDHGQSFCEMKRMATTDEWSSDIQAGLCAEILNAAMWHFRSKALL